MRRAFAAGMAALPAVLVAAIASFTGSTSPAMATGPTPAATPALAPTPTPVPPLRKVSYRLPVGSWPPHAVIVGAQIPGSGGRLLTQFHPAHDLAALGRLNGYGYEEIVDWHGRSRAHGVCAGRPCITADVHPLVFTYVVNVFATAAGATRAFNDAAAVAGGTIRPNVAPGLPWPAGQRIRAYLYRETTDRLAVLLFCRGHVEVEMTATGASRDVRFTAMGLIALDEAARTLDSRSKREQ